MRRVLAAVAGIAISMAASAGSAQTVYPIDRADILTGARFDFKVEFAGLADPAKISVTLNGKDYASRPCSCAMCCSPSLARTRSA